MRRYVPTLVALAMLTTVLAGSTWGSAAPARLLVGYDPADADAARLAIVAAGGTVQRSSAELGFSVVKASDPDTFRRVVSASTVIDYVEDDSATSLDGAQWNGAQWNGAQWNGAQWNGAQWNGAQWNNMRNEGAQWNGAQWNAHQWTIRYAPSKWSYDTGSLDPGLVWQWGTWATNTPAAWKTTTGTRAATLCVLDSGVAWDHGDIAPNAWTGPLGEQGWNAIDPKASAYDDAGHGTHVAGIAAGAVGNAWGMSGVANARIMPVKVLDSTGHGMESDLAFGMVWCAQQGADVALMALSVTEPGPTLDRAFQYAAARDVLMVASAGNDGPCDDCVAYPASDPRIVAVGAVDGNLRPAPFSNRGADLEVMAPGVDVLGPLPGNAFAFGSGTSQAAAFAAGMASLIRDANPHLTATEARSLLQASAVDLQEAGPDPLTGFGLMDARAGLLLALSE